jgi:hypothetical protein
VLYKEISAAEFVRAEDAVDVLSSYNKIVFGKESEADQVNQMREKRGGGFKLLHILVA